MNKNRKIYIGIIMSYLSYLLVLLNIFMGIYFEGYEMLRWLFFGFEILIIGLSPLFYFLDKQEGGGEWS